MIHIKQINKETTNFSTFIMMDGRLMRLSFSMLTSYLLPKQLSNPSFDDIFMFRKEAFTNDEIEQGGKKFRMNHHMYNWIRETDYSNLSGKWHELQWDEIKTEDHGYYLIISDSKNKYTMAIPPSSTYRRDCITIDGKYHYDCGDKFVGIEIICKGK